MVFAMFFVNERRKRGGSGILLASNGEGKKLADNCIYTRRCPTVVQYDLWRILSPRLSCSLSVDIL